MSTAQQHFNHSKLSSHTRGDITSNVRPRKEIMSKAHHYRSIDDLLQGSVSGFSIVHRERGLGMEIADRHERIRSILTRRFSEEMESLVTLLGQPSETADEWDLGIPTWASGGGYALWVKDDDFISLFVSWDNPEDPSFVVLVRAPYSQLSREPGAADPWREAWMHFGEW